VELKDKEEAIYGKGRRKRNNKSEELPHLKALGA
jgi:hypothetical protein